MFKIQEVKPVELAFIITSQRFDAAIEAALLKYHELLEDAEEDDRIDGSLVFEQNGAQLRFNGWRNSILYVARPLLDQLKLLKVEPTVYDTDYPIEYNESLLEYIQERGSYAEVIEYLTSVMDDIYLDLSKKIRLGLEPDQLPFRVTVYQMANGKLGLSNPDDLEYVKEAQRRRARLRIEQIEAVKPLLAMYNQIIEVTIAEPQTVEELVNDCNETELEMALKLIGLFRPDIYIEFQAKRSLKRPA